MSELAVEVRDERPDESDAVRRVVLAAFGHREQLVGDLVDRLRSSGRAQISLVAELDGEIVGHVMLSRSWVDAMDRLVDVLVLSPLSVVPERQREGLGTALIASALDAARRTGSPAVFLEGAPHYYSRRGFEGASQHGFTPPTRRIPDAAFQVALLDTHEPWMAGALVYCDPFWELDCAGLRGERLTSVEQKLSGWLPDPAG